MAIGSACRAQSATLAVEPPALPLSCLSLAQGAEALRFPSDAAPQLNAVVRVEMTFSSSQASPLVKTLSNSGDTVFEAAVARRVAAYRLPCLEAGRSVTLQQTFDFKGAKPEADRTLAFDAHYAVDPLAEVGCTADGLDQQPTYPAGLLGLAPPGTVIVQMRFNAAGDRPVVTVRYDGGSPRLVASVLRVVENYRLRCEKPLAHPVVARQTFDFKVEGGPEHRLKESLTLQQLLGAVESLDRHKVRFDLATMDCPFQVQFKLYQPIIENDVDADVRNHPARRDFARWLGQLVLAIPRQLLPAVIGQSSLVSVPFALLDLT